MNQMNQPDVPTPSNKLAVVDIHVVAVGVPAAIRAALLGLGFKEQKVLGGDPRVRMNHLFSIKHAGYHDSDKAYAMTRQICADHPGFIGYVEQELVAEDLRFDRAGQAPAFSPFPCQVAPQPCPPDLYKRCDIHVTSRASGPVIHEILAEAGFYHLLLHKQELGATRVNTLQFESARDGWLLWRKLVEYLTGCGNFCGSAKLELTRGFERFGDYALPPIVRTSSLQSSH